MIETQYLSTLRIIHDRLANTPVNWVITGSLGMALQGMDIKIHDIDIQTDQDGACKLEQLFYEFVIRPVQYTRSERIRSHLGLLEIGGIKVEIMGNIQKRLEDHAWEEPVKLEDHKRWVEIDNMRIPVLSLEYEYQAYLKLGRTKKAEMLRQWLARSDTG